MPADSIPADAPRPQTGLLSLLGFAVATALVAWLGSLATMRSVDSQWFETLEKPGFYPPNAAFGIVWTILYVLIAIAGWLAWRNGGGARVLLPWSLQLVLNLAWPVAFFGFREPLPAMVIILALLAATIWAVVATWPHSRTAVWLFVPYVLWVGFAATLNWSILALN